MRRTKWDTFEHQIVGQFRGQQKPGRRRAGHRLSPDREAADQGRQHPERVLHCFDSVKKRALILLQVAVVTQGEPLQHGQQTHEMPVHPSRLAPDQLRHVRVLLLRHHAAAGAERVRQLHKPKFLGRPEHQLFREPGGVRHYQCQGRQGLHYEVPVGHRIQAVLADHREAEQAGRIFTIQREVRACQRARAERHDIDPAERVAQAALVPLRHLHVRQEVVGEQDRLRPLHMGIARHDHAELPPRQGHEALLEPPQAGEEVFHRVAQIEPQIQRHLVVAAPSGVELAAHFADEFGQPRLDRHVNVLVRRREPEPPAGDLLLHLLEPADQFVRLAAGEHAGPLERPAVRDAPGNVVPVEPAVDCERRRERLDLRIRLATEPASPELTLRGFSFHTHPRRDLVGLGGAPLGGAPSRLMVFRREARMASRSAFSRMKPSASFCR